ncbi:UNKNOWN [Stylonychia lemnae]|uniref:EF-hand domain-containing protein n=1 Tax=Stylonychia lemnae TaxID=5949 RepID=A0A078B278_STYLE|nr:UNKNOWN [Stylonychia lemnae]|eukprot:CDW87543.1 UNKNOWN [Stylonychia lemnae]
MLSFLKDLITTNPFVEEIDLENKGITSLDPHSVDLLGRFSELKKINIADNHIRKLPNDLSAMQYIQEFNLNGNPIDDIESAVDSLQTMPNLKVLFINLHEEEQVDYLLRSLNSLEYLNGLAVERDALFNDENEDEQDQEGASPSQDQILNNQEDQTQEDVSVNNNQQHPHYQLQVDHEEEQQPDVVVEEAQEEYESSQRIPESDFKDYQQQQEEYQEEDENEQNYEENHDYPLQSSYQMTNDGEFQQFDDVPEENELRAQDLENIAILYDQIRAIRRKIEHNIDKRLAEEFDQHLKNIMYDLSVSLQELQDDQRTDKDIMKKKIILQTKKSLIGMCFKQTNQRQSIQPKPQDSLIAKKIEEHDKIKDNIIEGLQKTVHSQDEEIAALKSQKETAEILEAAETLEKESNKNAQIIDQLKKELNEQKDYYEQQQVSLEEENKRLLETLIRHSKTKASNNSTPVGSNMGIYHSQNFKESVQQTSLLMNQQQQPQNTTPFQNISQNQFNQPQRNTSSSASLSSMNKNFNQSQQVYTSQNQFTANQQHQANQFVSQNFGATLSPTSQPSTNHKILPLKQLKDIINDIYQQKIKYDVKCRESRLPIETMEQYMYTYLNQKYGLKSLIIEWASTIIHGVRTYLKDDHEVTLFGKILKNECDEEFRFIQMHVKDTLANLLKILVREKHHLKSEGEIIQICEQIQVGFIEDVYWKKIINKMYDSEDVNTLTNRFLEIIDQRKLNRKENNFHSSVPLRTQEKSNTRKISRDEEIKQRRNVKQVSKLMYQEFLKIILDFQLLEHEKFLSCFTQIFKSIDTDSNGIIDENEFRDLIIKMGVVQTMEEVEQLLSIIDPHNNKQMTYSEIVQLLSSQLTQISDDNMRQVPLLEKFVNQMLIAQNAQNDDVEGGYCQDGAQIDFYGQNNMDNQQWQRDIEQHQQYQHQMQRNQQQLNQDLEIM